MVLRSHERMLLAASCHRYRFLLPHGSSCRATSAKPLSEEISMCCRPGHRIDLITCRVRSFFVELRHFIVSNTMPASSHTYLQCSPMVSKRSEAQYLNWALRSHRRTVILSFLVFQGPRHAHHEPGGLKCIEKARLLQLVQVAVGSSQITRDRPKE
jgi:hypothetical protein